MEILSIVINAATIAADVALIAAILKRWKD